MSITFYICEVVAVLIVVAVIRGIKEKNEKKRNGSDSGNVLPRQVWRDNETKTMKQRSGISLWILSMVGLCFFMATFFLLEFCLSRLWNTIRWIILPLEVTLFLALVAAFLFHIYIKRQKIVFGEDSVTVSQPFKADEVICWAAFGRMEIQAERCMLYDRYGQLRLKVTASWENYGLFCQMARRKLEENGGETIWR